MEILIYVLLLVLIVLGTLSVIPRSNSKGKGNGGVHPLGSGKTSRSYTKKEVSTHNTRKDCWIIIKDKVYNVTSYVEEHPGGDAILNNAGDDSTEGFFGFVTHRRLFTLHSAIIAHGTCFSFATENIIYKYEFQNC
ncbi:unnamed protein product [Miscanthus lutarioriparius]|uniref:Cytochrome b5 heme-binding domain-containing protein n=1 Tax=Miscanthus lutarioriparius TaxID=422564 RepID=A0A811NI25_9POAL|nr:unnamed protein product [Miscanthus lutarioriparius]